MFLGAIRKKAVRISPPRGTLVLTPRSTPDEKRGRTMKRRFVLVLFSFLLITAAASSQGAVLSVDAGTNHWRAINKNIYGVNIANWCQAYYLELCTPMLVSAKVSVVRYGATNIERYNWRNNRMYNVISLTNQYVPTSWESFVAWVREDVGAEPFQQASVLSHVAAQRHH
jgi:hypothetical protein